MTAGVTLAAERSQAGISLVAAAVIGNALEWFDFTVYSLFSVTIAKVFFPVGTEIGSLLLTLATFGVGFVLRPVGAVVLGQYADRAGRRAALSLIIVLMSVGTAIIALTPGYARIGLAAPILIVVARLIQGFSVGGEFGGATAFLIESAPPDRRGLYASWQFAGQAAAAIAGSLSGVVITSLLTAEQVLAWGWRIPFCLGLLIAPVGLYLRARMAEAPEFERDRRGGAPLLDVWRHYREPTIRFFGLTVLGTAATYLVLFYMPTYATRLLGIPYRDSFVAATIASLLLFALNPVAGRLSDRIGRERLLLAAAIGLALLAYPSFLLLTQLRSLPVLLIVQGGLAACLAMFTGPSAALVGEMFPPHVRSTGLSLGYNLAVPIFGGFAPFIVAGLDTGDHLAPAYYMIACAVPTLLALRWKRR